MEKKNPLLTLESELGELGYEFEGLLVPFSLAHSAHRKLSIFLACSMVIPIQVGWNLHRFKGTDSINMKVKKVNSSLQRTEMKLQDPK
jgi:hypothetical protein